MSKSGKPRSAPKIKAPSKKHPNVMKENQHSDSRKKTAVWPLKSKRLSK